MPHKPALLIIDMQTGLLGGAPEFDRTVAVIAHHNQIFGIIEYSGRSVGVLPSSDVDFREP